MNRFEGKVALVTGAGRGIGKATLARFAAEGAKVAAADLAFDDDVPGLQIQTDVTSREQVEAAVARTVEELGGLDILVTSAGIIRDNLVHKLSDDDWDAVITTHLRGTFLATQAAQAHMTQHGGDLLGTLGQDDRICTPWQPGEVGQVVGRRAFQHGRAELRA